MSRPIILSSGFPTRCTLSRICSALHPVSVSFTSQLSFWILPIVLSILSFTSPCTTPSIRYWRPCIGANDDITDISMLKGRTKIGIVNNNVLKRAVYVTMFGSLFRIK